MLNDAQQSLRKRDYTGANSKARIVVERVDKLIAKSDEAKQVMNDARNTLSSLQWEEGVDLSLPKTFLSRAEKAFKDGDFIQAIVFHFKDTDFIG